MNLYFNAAEISDHDENSHSITRFISSLSDEQAASCIDHELKHGRRNDVLALLAAQRVAKKKITPDQENPNQQHKTTVLSFDLPATAQGQILNALQLSRAHVRCPLDGSARTDLIKALDTALALMGVR